MRLESFYPENIDKSVPFEAQEAVSFLRQAGDLITLDAMFASIASGHGFSAFIVDFQTGAQGGDLTTEERWARVEANRGNLHQVFERHGEQWRLRSDHRFGARFMDLWEEAGGTWDTNDEQRAREAIPNRFEHRARLSPCTIRSFLEKDATLRAQVRSL